MVRVIVRREEKEKTAHETLSGYSNKVVKSGISGLDDIINGGIPEGSFVTLRGGPGTGKTVFGLQFIYRGAKDYNENGVFISLEEEPEQLIKTCESFGWDIKNEIKKGKVSIVKFPLYKFNVLKDNIREELIRMKAKRLVIDPGTMLEVFFDRPIDSRKAIDEINSMLKKQDCTGFITDDGKNLASIEPSDYYSDGLMILYYTKVAGSFIRMITVIKMRSTHHSDRFHPIRFTDKGIEVLSREAVPDYVLQDKI